MFGQFGTFARQLSTRRAAQNSTFIGRSLEEFFEKGQRLPVSRDQTGRAWSASELRQKSWEDLQKLWYVVLKERNMLASQKEEARRLGIPSQFFSNQARVIKCKKTMARIKSVLAEREIAWRKASEEAEAASKTTGAATTTTTTTTSSAAATATAAAAETGPAEVNTA
ncbi:54S ribosomal protein L4 mitochondrial [Coemansia interrupta]|uniref:Large ribosomal subunit protein uL29m n=1 Tax=Coemansia interrupta TaxID=1126814 RepID=A0A9W8LJB0_9FUNG|nr:54S ribosomal protein L4 mitochondrial [Coemansia interrupta]